MRHLFSRSAMRILALCLVLSLCLSVLPAAAEGTRTLVLYWTNVGGDIEGATPIRFSSSLAQPQTKAYASLSATHTSFRVFAFYQPGNISEDPALHFPARRWKINWPAPTAPRTPC